MKVFLDTNVVVSALATRGLCADLYERLLTGHEVAIGEPVIIEVLDILQRKFFANGDLLTKVEAELRLLRVIPAQAVAPALPIRDVDDPWIIACALQADVDCFVTGDAELLALEMVDNLPIISPRVCWEKWSGLARSSREDAVVACSGDEQAVVGSARQDAVVPSACPPHYSVQNFRGLFLLLPPFLAMGVVC